MDMLEDYLRAVSRLLPRAKRDDITAELRDEILTRIEAKEAELGRKLSDDETEKLLRDFGHPIVVAARYREGPQYSVGPALYPFWIFAVRFAILLELCVSTIVFIVRAVSGGNIPEAFGSAIGSGITGVMTLIGFATIAAWLIERKGITIDYFNTWRVRDLRFLDFAFWDWTDVTEWLESKRNHTPRDYSGYGRHYGWTMRQSSAGRGVGAIVVGVVFIMWWVGILSFGLSPVPVDYSVLNVDPGRLANVDYAAFKSALYWPVLAYFSGLIIFGASVLAFPRGVRLRGLIDIVIGGSVIALVGWVWTASPIAEVVRVASVAELIARIEAFFAHPVPVPLELVATVFLILTAFGGFCRAVGGLWEVLFGAPRYVGDT